MNIKLLAAAAASTLVLAACDKQAGGNATKSSAAVPSAGTAAGEGGAQFDPNDFTTQIVATPEGGFRMGNPNAPVKLIEFASLTCHVCRDFSKDSTPALVDNYVKSGKVSYEFRHILRDPIDVAASMLARCGGPAPFFKITEQLFAEQDATLDKAQKISPADAKAMEGMKPGQELTRLAQLTGLERFVGMRGIPAAKAEACLSNEAEVNRLVAASGAASKEYKIPGTPTFVINGKEVENISAWKFLEPKIREAMGGA